MKAVGKRLGLAMAASCLWASLGTAQADVGLWYNGDYDGNQTGPILNSIFRSSRTQQAFVYQEFIVPAGQTWTISQVYSNDEISTDSVTNAHWEIVTDVVPNTGATRIDSGYATPSLTPITGSPGDYTVTVSGLDVVLSAGTYWLSVTPVVGRHQTSYILSTSGANGTGVVTGSAGSSYIDGSFYGATFEPSQDYTGLPPDGYSMGVIGTVASVPEPSTMVLGVIGTLTLLGYAGLRRRLGA